MQTNSKILEQLKTDLKKVSKERIIEWKDKALQNRDYFQEVVITALGTSKPYNWRAAWVVSRIAETNINLVQPYLENILNSLDNFNNQSQIATFLRVLLKLKIDEEHFGVLADYCIKQIYSQQWSSHVKYYAIQLLQLIAEKFPELKREFFLVIEENLPYYEKAYLKNFAKSTLKKLQ